MDCPAADSLIGRYADDPAALAAVERQQLELHLASCEACRLVVDDQRHVARVLHARPQAHVPPAFAARLSKRLDSEPQGFLALANWRAWTVTVSPVAAALLLVAWVGLSGTATQPDRSTAATDTFTTWTEATATGDAAAVFLQPATGDGLVEAVLTGAAAPGADTDGR
jgi:putative zinc finger protein